MLTLTTAPSYYYPQLREKEEDVGFIETLSGRTRTTKPCYWISSCTQKNYIHISEVVSFSTLKRGV